jgi:hypothetical protein
MPLEEADYSIYYSFGLRIVPISSLELNLSIPKLGYLCPLAFIEKRLVAEVNLYLYEALDLIKGSGLGRIVVPILVVLFLEPRGETIVFKSNSVECSVSTYRLAWGPC